MLLDWKAAYCRKGKAKYTNGGRYEGDFKKEHRWGWGLHIFPDGDRYEGQWVDDKIQGGRAILIVMLTLYVAPGSITARPNPKQCVHAVSRVLRCTLLCQPASGCYAGYWQMPDLQACLRCASFRKVMPLTLRACRHVPLRRSVAVV